MPDQDPILVTGAAGKVGAVGRTVVELLRRHDLPVRALVRRHDERADALSATAVTLRAPSTLPAPWRAADACISG
jgi:uncharacterized protein YbjT (DUF2867 family)